LDNRVQVHVRNLGLTDFARAWDLQEETLRSVAEQKVAARSNPSMRPRCHLFLVEHPPVFTLGKGGSEENLLVSPERLEQLGISYYRINRGGDITYHGPGQMVVYPVWDLDQIYTDIHRFLRDLEEVVIRTVADFGIAGASRKEGLTGVWVGEEKICAMGIRASRWITMHGIALNVNTDLENFKLILPCGIVGKGVCSMQSILGRPVPESQVRERLLAHLQDVFPITLVEDAV
jgi:lipoyl(octanoyl) transferase